MDFTAICITHLYKGYITLYKDIIKVSAIKEIAVIFSFCSIELNKIGDIKYPHIFYLMRLFCHTYNAFLSLNNFNCI